MTQKNLVTHKCVKNLQKKDRCHIYVQSLTIFPPGSLV